MNNCCHLILTSDCCHILSTKFYFFRQFFKHLCIHEEDQDHWKRNWRLKNLPGKSEIFNCFFEDKFSKGEIF